MNVAIACGGSGGHLFPGVAVAETLRLRGHRVMLLVSGKEIDRQAAATTTGFEVRTIPAIAMPPLLSLRLLTFAVRFFQSAHQCSRLFDEFKPAVVLGTGGFTSVPAALAAWQRRVPFVTHESNAIPGRATRLLARFAAAVAVGMEECAAYFPSRRVVNTGTPVRGALRRLPAGEARWQLGLDEQRRTVLIAGGSQGARGLNSLVIEALPGLRHLGRQVQFIHLTGEADFERVRAAYEANSLKAVVRPFLKEMELAYSASVLAVSRSGAAALSELAWFGLPSVLVPFPVAADNHQFFNADSAAKRGGARVMTETATTGAMLAATIDELLRGAERRTMAEKMAELRRADAASALASLLAEVGGIVEPVVVPRELQKNEIVRLLGDRACAVHLVGVAGCGMSGIARLLLARGHRVSGSDTGGANELDALRGRGATVFAEHAAGNIGKADLVVYSNAIAKDNPEILAAKGAGIPIVRRARILAAVMQTPFLTGKPAPASVCVAGIHGKTTTSAMVAHVLKAGGRDPSFCIGGYIGSLGGNAGEGAGEFFVAESDESDGTLVEYAPTHSVVMNVEEEHLDYYRDLQAILDTFAQFVENTRDRVFFCADDANAARLCSGHPRAVSFGFAADATYRASDVRQDAGGTRFVVKRAGHALGEIALAVPGQHNVSNATAAAAVGMTLGLTFEQVAAALAAFRGADRRLEVKFEDKNYLVVDDYAHHPTEQRATLEALRSLGRRRVIVAFQPHRYTRTKLLSAQFGKAFDGADKLVLTDVYAASEPVIEGISGRTIFEAVKANGHHGVEFEPELARVADRLLAAAQPGDIIAILGAGDIYKVAEEVARRVRAGQVGARANTVMKTEDDIYAELRSLLGLETVLLRNEPMAKKTTFQIGGNAQFWCEPATESDLGKVLGYCAAHRLPFFLIGRGSNLLVRDSGIKGVVIRLSHAAMSRVEVSGGRIVAGAGAKVRDVVMAAKHANLAGLEFLEGIPGSVGGALRMNAGAMGQWTFEMVESVRFMDYAGNVYEKPAGEIHYEYRGCPLFRDHIALSAVFKGTLAAHEAIANRLKSFQQKRWSSQPRESSAGCIFKNPKQIPAGKLIDELGLKGKTMGKARVSEVHGNFIVNDGGATAADVLQLIEFIKKRAQEERGIELETEVMILGE
ncbi:MAG: UDP-N-acetylmuramate--L-alanine ligase [Verrucomicrobiia bacterium]|jgi:UDP-N-acetylmuramate--L-alanine ligase/undecaprenyldiphospho-muramoylpentapeptide beta-N-acetylglucosaminyltransferase/UDP-N-acetylenolpyruvoylglucosamine reductase